MRTILTRLSAALADSSGTRTGDLVVLNMFDPYQNDCLAHPQSRQVFEDLDARLAAVAAEVGAPVVDVFATFGGRVTAQNDLVCTYTYMCARPQDVHPTRAGHDAIARALHQTLGY
ncbi:hypothetical protein [Kineococcus glutinatus]